MTDYRERIKIPVDVGDSTTEFFTKCGTHVATGYKRIVLGKRGPYIEFDTEQINRNDIFIPDGELWRMDDAMNAYYFEYRSKDACNVKIYFQKKLVDYADYKLGYIYISPFDLKTGELDVIVTSVRVSALFDTDKFF